MQQSPFFTATGYMIAAIVILANAAAIATHTLDPDPASNGSLGFVFLAAGRLAVIYVFLGLARTPLAALLRFLRSPRGAPAPKSPRLLEAEARDRPR